MGERDSAVTSLRRAAPRRLILLALGVAAWVASFAALARLGTWTSFALLGALLGGLSLLLEAVPVSLLRPSPSRVGIGLLAGLLMVLITHVAFTGVAALIPEVRAATVLLFAFLHVGSFSPAARATLIVLIATCEEVLFRGTLPGASAGREEYPLRKVAWRDLVLIVAFAAAYALTTLPLGSPLLLVCAFLCGVVWGAMRLMTGSLVVPIITHVVWDLGVLVVWPLVV